MYCTVPVPVLSTVLYCTLSWMPEAGVPVPRFCQGPSETGSGQQTVDSGQWTVDSGKRTVDSGKRTVDSGQLAVDSGQWT